MRRPLIALACPVLAAGLWAAACRSAALEAPPADPVAEARTAASTPLRVQVPPPPFSDGIFPCTECHTEADLPTNPERRQLVDAHDDIVLEHDAEHRWCLDCHDAVNRDQLHLASGAPVSFEESYQLCGQCHGEKYRDWRVGVHGRRVGQWNGAKEYLLCVHCHNPHSPRFKALEPEPAPLRPTRTGRNP
ncbi:MAG TPA: cytochrome c3 family protein [Vicinamibacterales bacterium]|nr:cytochrome c3 family protein [Vicinamibacterales bacterium]